MAFSSNQLTVPPGFPELLQGLAKEVLRKQPKDIIGFAYDHFAAMVNERSEQEKLNKATDIENTTNSFKPNSDVIIPLSSTQQENNINNNSNNIEEDEDELPDLNSFDNNEVNAITKIQSGFRGMKARKEVKIKKQESQIENTQQEEIIQPENIDEDEELPDLNSFDPNEVNAITKIQSGFRGMKARKEVKVKKQESQIAHENEVIEPSAPTESQVTNHEDDEELPDLNSFDASEVNAITKIQSGFRGMQARKEVKSLKTTEVSNVLSPRNEELPPSTAGTNHVLSPRNDQQTTSHTPNVEKIEETNNNNQEEEELPDLNSFDAAEVNAISKIQAGFRGMRVRKEISKTAVDESAESEKPVVEEEKKVEDSNNNEEEELPDLNSFDNNEVNAITKIQAGFRGMQGRKKVKNLESSSKDDVQNDA